MTLPKMHNVISSHIVSVGYDDGTQNFFVRYAPTERHPAGRVVVYKGVEPDAAESVYAAPSIGSAIRDTLRTGGYAWEYLD